MRKPGLVTASLEMHGGIDRNRPGVKAAAVPNALLQDCWQQSCVLLQELGAAAVADIWVAGVRTAVGLAAAVLFE